MRRLEIRARMIYCAFVREGRGMETDMKMRRDIQAIV